MPLVSFFVESPFGRGSGRGSLELRSVESAFVSTRLVLGMSRKQKAFVPHPSAEAAKRFRKCGRVCEIILNDAGEARAKGFEMRIHRRPDESVEDRLDREVGRIHFGSIPG